MTAPHDLDRHLDAFLLDGPTELPDPSFDAIRDRIEETRQRAAIGPWRMPDMNKLVPIGLGAAAVVVAVVVGSQLLAPPAPGDVGAASPSAAPSPTAETSVAPPSAVAETFTSERHGISMSYPAGWVTRPAAEPWTAGVPDFGSNAGDVVHDPVHKDNLWIAVASQAIGDATPEAWAAETIALDDGCTATAPVTVDGATGLIGTDDCTRAAVTIDGRGYFIWLYSSGDDPALSTYDRAWFEQVLATVQLKPEAAIDPTSVSS